MKSPGTLLVDGRFSEETWRRIHDALILAGEKGTAGSVRRIVRNAQATPVTKWYEED